MTTDTTEPSVRDVLLAHSDDRPCRALWAAVSGDAAMPDPATCVAALEATAGDLCLVARDADVETYLRYDPEYDAFVSLAVWPPWGVVDGRTTDRDGAAARLAEAADPRPVPVEQTPMAVAGPPPGAGGSAWAASVVWAGFRGR